MKIVRDGKAIRLTGAEMRKAYEIVKRDCVKTDIVCKAEEVGIELTDEEIEDIATIVNSGLSHNDSYWESYWLTIEYAIEQSLKGETIKIITKSMIHNGYTKGVVYLINNPNDDCIAANIGANWFYFAGSENENMTVKEYKEEYTSEEIVDYIFSVLDSDFKTEFEDEYLYYYYYLKECGC